MSYPNFDLVQKAFEELKSEGIIKPVPATDQHAVEEQKGILTMRSGYYSNQRDSNIGILEKTSGNNYKGFSVDILIQRNGDFWDIATDVETSPGMRMAAPVNGGPSHDDNLIPRWRQPTKELAGIENGGNGEPPPPDGDIDDKLNQIIATQGLIIGILNQQQQILFEHTAKLDQILAKLNEGGSVDKFPIIYPSYSFRDLFGRVQTMQPTPPSNP